MEVGRIEMVGRVDKVERIEMVGRVDGVEFVEVPVWVSERGFENK